MGNQTSASIHINYEDMQFILRHPEEYILINTLQRHEQDCLIANTLSFEREENILNQCLQQSTFDVRIVVYGKHCTDETVSSKHQQLLSLGFREVYIYQGGLFEWLLLQDIYGENEFPTTSKELNLLKFKPSKLFHAGLLRY